MLDAALKEVGAEREKFAALSQAGEECLWRGEWDAAVARFTEAIASDPNNGAHYSRRSEAHLSAGRCADAIADAKTGTTLGGTTSAATAGCFCQLGFALARDGKTQAAREAYERGLKHDAEHTGCRQGRDEMSVALERGASGVIDVAAGPDDVEAQELHTLPTPEEILGKGFEVVHLKVGECDESLRFLLSSTTIEEAVVLPSTCALLGLQIRRRVTLENMRFEGGAAIGSFEGVSVSNFVQAQLSEKALGVTIHGMLGLPFLVRYDMDLDRVRNTQRFKEAGSVAAAKGKADRNNASGAGLNLSGIELPRGLVGIPVMVRPLRKQAKPFLGVIDTSSMFSVLSWQAARELGIATASLNDAVKVVGASKDGPVEMPLVNVKINLCGTPEGLRLTVDGGLTKEEFEQSGKANGWSIKLDVAELKPNVEFGRVNAAIGDAIQFQCLADSTVGEFNGGVILIGQDILAQARRLTVSARDQRVWIDPPGRLVDTSPI